MAREKLHVARSFYDWGSQLTGERGEDCVTVWTQDSRENLNHIKACQSVEQSFDLFLDSKFFVRTFLSWRGSEQSITSRKSTRTRIWTSCWTTKRWSVRELHERFFLIISEWRFHSLRCLSRNFRALRHQLARNSRESEGKITFKLHENQLT